MDLRLHVQRLVDLNPLLKNNKISENLPALFDIAINDSQTRGEYEFLTTLLLFLCLMTYIAHGRYALLPLRALVGHLLLLCPGAKDLFLLKLTASCPELKNALS